MKCLCNPWKSSSMIISAGYPTAASNSPSEAEEDGAERSSSGTSGAAAVASARPPRGLRAALARPPLGPGGPQPASGRPLCAGRPAHGPAGQRLHARPRPQAPGLRRASTPGQASLSSRLPPPTPTFLPACKHKHPPCCQLNKRLSLGEATF